MPITGKNPAKMRAALGDAVCLDGEPIGQVCDPCGCDIPCISGRYRVTEVKSCGPARRLTREQLCFFICFYISSRERPQCCAALRKGMLSEAALSYFDSDPPAG